MTKIQWIDIVRDWLAGGDSPAELRGTYHPAVVEKYLGIGFDTLLNKNLSKKDDLRDELGQDNWKYDALTKVYYAEILFDSRRKRFYSDLPKSVMSINNNNGIRMICPVEEEATQFLPRRFEDTFLMNGLDVNLMSGLIYYTVEGINKVYYSGTLNNCWKEVMMKLAVRFDDLEEDDVITVPDGLDVQIFDVVRQILASKLPQDIENDSEAAQTSK